MATQIMQGYRVLNPLGEGALGVVYSAEDGQTGRRVALRVFTGNLRWDPELRAQLRAHVDAVSRLNHVNIAHVYGCGEDGNSPFISSELMEGRDLARVIAEGALPVEKRIALMCQIAGGLACAHNAGIIHCDLKPAEIFVTGDDVVKIIDIGLAHVLARGLARPAVRWRSPIYLAPEQVRDKHYDARSEIFVAGMIFYELLTGEHPFQHDNGNRILDDIASEEIVPDFGLLEDGPPGLLGLVERCLAKDPADRFADMNELALACEELLRDISRECQEMLVELQVALPKLKKAASLPDAPDELGVLAAGIQSVASGGGKRDYAALDRLMSELAAHNEVVHSLLSAAKWENSGADLDFWEMKAAAPVDDYAASEPDDMASVNPFAPLGASLTEAGSPKPENEPVESAAEAESLGLDRHELEFLQSAVPGRVDDPDPTIVSAAAATQESVPDEPVPADATETVIAGPEPPEVAPQASFPRIAVRPAIWAAAAAALVLVAALAWYLRSNAQSRASLRGAPVASAAAGIVAGNENPASAGDSGKSGSAAADLLVQQAEVMLAQGRAGDGRLFLNRALELDPESASAQALRDRLEAGTTDGQVEDGAIRRRVNDATALIVAGQLRNARIEINRIAAASPDHAALPGLRRSLEAKTAELARDAERKKTEQADAVRRAVAEENWSRHAGDLFRAGKYAELQHTVDEWVAESPGSVQAENLRARGAEAQQLIRVIEPAIADRRYADATVALARLEAVNPSDPAISTLRHGLDSRKAAARATLSVFRLAEAGSVLFDGFPIGTGGEIDGAPVAIGEHTIAVKTGSGPAASLVHDFSDGEKSTFVYDGRTLRAMTGSDTAALSARKARELVYRFPVEHAHGLLRGTCRGELLISGLEIRFEPSAGSHGFHMPFGKLKLRIEGRNVELRYASDDASFQSFRTRTPADSEQLQQTWGKLSR